jgi:hypothetical protein
MAGSKITTDHDEIRKWAEERGGRPSTVRSTHGKGQGPGPTHEIAVVAEPARL